MTVTPRPKPLHPTVDTFTDLQAWLDDRLANIESDLGDPETCQHLGVKGQDRLRAYRTAYLGVAAAIADAVAREEDLRTVAAQADLVEEYLKAYGDEPLIQRRMDGDR